MHYRFSFLRFSRFSSPWLYRAGFFLFLKKKLSQSSDLSHVSTQSRCPYCWLKSRLIFENSRYGVGLFLAVQYAPVINPPPPPQPFPTLCSSARLTVTQGNEPHLPTIFNSARLSHKGTSLICLQFIAPQDCLSHKGTSLICLQLITLRLSHKGTSLICLQFIAPQDCHTRERALFAYNL